MGRPASTARASWTENVSQRGGEAEELLGVSIGMVAGGVDVLIISGAEVCTEAAFLLEEVVDARACWGVSYSEPSSSSSSMRMRRLRLDLFSMTEVCGAG